MNFWRSSCWLFSRFFSAMESFAFASSSAATCVSRRASRSAVSICARSWPWATLSPSRTSTRFTSPGTFDFTVVCTTGASEPENGIERTSSRTSTTATSAAVNSRVTCASDFLSSFFACVARSPAKLATTSTRARVTTRDFLRKDMVGFRAARAATEPAGPSALPRTPPPAGPGASPLAVGADSEPAIGIHRGAQRARYGKCRRRALGRASRASPVACPDLGHSIG